MVGNMKLGAILFLKGQQRAVDPGNSMSSDADGTAAMALGERVRDTLDEDVATMAVGGQVEVALREQVEL